MKKNENSFTQTLWYCFVMPAKAGIHIVDSGFRRNGTVTFLIPRWKHRGMHLKKYIFGMVFSLLLHSCGPKEIEPVELYPEDECATCRMTVSDPSFASEIINKDGSVVKFDDLRCFENYRKEHNVDDFEKIFVKDYETKKWIPFGKSIVIFTGIETPMGSGQVAVADQQRAKKLKEQYPPEFAAMQGDACCAPKQN